MKSRSTSNRSKAVVGHPLSFSHQPNKLFNRTSSSFAGSRLLTPALGLFVRTMDCTTCGSSDFHRPEEKSSLEIWLCKQCGAELAVHCHYPPDLSSIQLHDLFIGTASVGSGSEALKAVLQLKKALSFAERFEPAKLEEQHRAGKLTWNLGYFFDFEVQRAETECERIGVHASFRKDI